MASLDLNPIVEIMSMQRRKISECIRAIIDDIEDRERNCNYINEMLQQLEQLCQMHFLYEIKLLEEIHYPAAAKQKENYELLVKSIEPLKVSDGQCHTPSFYNDFNRLRLDFISTMNDETMLLCGYLLENHSGNTAA